ncbi:hypothetical protein [Microbacterium sp. K2]|uniref:hypothetical protein n=1 Tax=Microbacterium sp. K2 TaxID=3391827 RepID=UPI003ED8D975
MDPMFPSQGNPPAEMLQDLRGSEKRAINYFWILVGELGLDGTSGRYYAEVVGTHSNAEDEPSTSPLSYDVVGASSDDIFEEGDVPPFREATEFLTTRHGLTLDPASWIVVGDPPRERVAVWRP